MKFPEKIAHTKYTEPVMEYFNPERVLCQKNMFYFKYRNLYISLKKCKKFVQIMIGMKIKAQCIRQKLQLFSL